MTTAQKLDSIATELGALNIMIGVQISTARVSLNADNRKAAIVAIQEADVIVSRIGACISDLLSIQTAPGLAMVDASAPVVQGCSAGTRGGTCADCGEYHEHLFPSIGGRWDYCRTCADRELAEEAPPSLDNESDGDNCQYPDPDVQRDEWLDRRMEAQG